MYFARYGPGLCQSLAIFMEDVGEDLMRVINMLLKVSEAARGPIYSHGHLDGTRALKPAGRKHVFQFCPRVVDVVTRIAQFTQLL